SEASRRWSCRASSRRRDDAQHRLAGTDAVADGDVPAHRETGRHPNLGARAELDHAVALARAELVARTDRAHDPPRERPGDLADDHLVAPAENLDARRGRFVLGDR